MQCTWCQLPGVDNATYTTAEDDTDVDLDSSRLSVHAPDDVMEPGVRSLGVVWHDPH